MLSSSWYMGDTFHMGVLSPLPGRRRVRTSTLLTLMFCSVSIAQNNPYVQVAYFEVVYSVPLQKKEYKQSLHIYLMAYTFSIYILNIHQYAFLNIHFCTCPSQLSHKVDQEDVVISILQLRKVKLAQVRKWS